MRILLLLIVTGLLLAWRMLPGGDAPKPALKPASVTQTRNNMAALEEAQAAGLLIEDTHRHELRQAVLDAGRRVGAAPCDDAAKDQLRHALDALLGHLRDTMDKAVETVAIDGRVIDASPVLNAAARAVWQDAAAAGIMRADEMPVVPARAGAPRMRPVAAGSGPYACRIG